MDERMRQERNQILSELALWMYGFIVLAFLVKVLFFEQSIKDCIVEYVILIAAPVYQFVRAHQRKLSLYPADGERIFGKKEKKRLFVSLAVGIIVFFICFWRMKPDWGETLTGLGSFAVAFVAARLSLVYIEKRRSERLNREYDEDE